MGTRTRKPATTSWWKSHTGTRRTLFATPSFRWGRRRAQAPWVSSSRLTWATAGSVDDSTQRRGTASRVLTPEFHVRRCFKRVPHDDTSRECPKKTLQESAPRRDQAWVKKTHTKKSAMA